MRTKLGSMLFLVVATVSCNLGYTYGYYDPGSSTIIYINRPVGGYYNSYYPYNLPAYSPYYSPAYNPYYYYPRYRCAVVPRCYPSGSCNYQNQECGFY